MKNIVKKIIKMIYAHAAPVAYQQGFWNSHAEKDPQQAILTGVKKEEDYYISGLCSLGYLENHISISEKWEVLDFGCGNGRVARFLAPKVKRVTGADISDKMLELFNNELGDQDNIHSVKISSSSLKELPDTSYDLIYSMLVLQHMNKKRARKTMKFLTNKMKIGAFIFIQFPSLEMKEQFPELYTTYNENDPSQPGLARTYLKQEINSLFRDNLISPLKIERLLGNYYVSGIKVTHKNQLRNMPDYFNPIYSTSIEILKADHQWLRQTKKEITCKVVNTGNLAWRNDEVDPINYVMLGIRLMDEQNSVVQQDFARASLPKKIYPGDSVTLTVLCPAIEKGGIYNLLIDMVNERNFWFHENTETYELIQIEVI